MERFLNIGVCLLAFLAVAGLAATAVMVVAADRGGGGEVSQNDGVPAPAATATRVLDAHIKEAPNPAREIPDLTENQIAEVKSLLDSDPSLKSLLAGGSYTIRQMGPWVSGGEREFIGALVRIGLDNPVDFDGVLPIAESYDKPEDGSGELYVDGGHVQRLQAQGIEVLRILIDLNKDKIVTIDVEKAATLHIDYEYGAKPPLRVCLIMDAGSAGVSPATPEARIDHRQTAMSFCPEPAEARIYGVHESLKQPFSDLSNTLLAIR